MMCLEVDLIATTSSLDCDEVASEKISKYSSWLLQPPAVEAIAAVIICAMFKQLTYKRQ
jgi:hypothetical protein